MAEEVETPQIQESKAEAQSAMDLELETAASLDASEAGNGAQKAEENGGIKRGRENCEEEETDATKKKKVETSVVEERSEEEGAEGEPKGIVDTEEEGKVKGPVKLGPKEFGSSEEMFDYFMNLMHNWKPNLDINKYEHLVLEDLLRKGHSDHTRKISVGVKAFQIRYHPYWKSRCFFVIRTDGSLDDFSFRKCVDHILPLPDKMKTSGKPLNGTGPHQRGGGRGGRGRGRNGQRGGRGGR